jgi:hypothetical protein
MEWQAALAQPGASCHPSALFSIKTSFPLHSHHFPFNLCQLALAQVESNGTAGTGAQKKRYSVPRLLA